MKKKLMLLLFAFLGVISYSLEINYKNTYTKNNMEIENWKLKEIEVDLDKDGKMDILCIYYNESPISGDVEVTYVAYIEDEASSYKIGKIVNHVFTKSTFATEYQKITNQYVANYIKKLEPNSKENDIKINNIEKNYIEKYNSKKSNNLTFNYKYDKNVDKDLENFILINKSVNVRENPSTNSNIIGKVNYPERIKVLGKVKSEGQNTNWFEVEYNGKVAYISEEYGTKREFDYENMMSRISKYNNFVKESLSNNKEIYVLDNYVPLGGGSGASKDKFGNRENQSQRAYLSSGFSDYINVPDRTTMTILEENNKYIKVNINSYDGEYYFKKAVKDRLKKSNIKNEVTRFIYIDTKSQNEIIVERANDTTWNMVTSSFVTTGKDGSGSYATPYGDFLIAYGKPVMQYTGSDNSTVVGDANNAIRFSGGGYMHSIPSVYEPKSTRPARRAATAKKIGTYPESHKCVRHYDDQIKFIYDWLGNSTPNDKNGYRVPEVPTIVIVK